MSASILSDPNGEKMKVLIVLFSWGEEHKDKPGQAEEE